MAKPKSTSKYEEWLKEENLIRVRGWARDGLIESEIAQKMEISFATLRAWKKKYPQFNRALSDGKDSIDRQVEETLFQKAIKGDTTAMIFWLKNRKPNDWRNYYERNTKEDNIEQQARIDKILLENEKLRAEIDQIRGESQEFTDDGFLEALMGTAEEDWEDGSDEV